MARTRLAWSKAIKIRTRYDSRKPLRDSYPFEEAPFGFHNTFGEMKGQLTFLNHSLMTLHRLEGKRWITSPVFDDGEGSPGFNARQSHVGFHKNAAACLNWDGALYAGNFGSRFRQIAPAGGPSGDLTGGKCVVFDAQRSEWLVFGGFGRSPTFAVTKKGWVRVGVSSTPPAQTSSAVETPVGILAHGRGQLWRWADGDWTRLSSFDGGKLFFDRARGLLLTCANRQLSIWDGEVFRQLPEMKPPANWPHELGLDSRNHRIVGFAKSEDELHGWMYTLALDGLELPRAPALPMGGTTAAGKTRQSH